MKKQEVLLQSFLAENNIIMESLDIIKKNHITFTVDTTTHFKMRELEYKKIPYKDCTLYFSCVNLKQVCGAPKTFQCDFLKNN